MNDKFESLPVWQMGEIKRLKQELDLAHHDKTRVDWLEENMVELFAWVQDDQSGNPSRRMWQCSNVGLEKARSSIREAIDAAINQNHMNTPKPPLDSLKNLKCSLTQDEFGLMRWCALRTRNGRGETIPLAEFFRQSVFDKCRDVVRGEIERGKAIPPDIAHFLTTLK